MSKWSTTGARKRYEAFRICRDLARNGMWHRCDMISARMDLTPWPFSNEQRASIRKLKQRPQKTYGGYWIDKEKRDNANRPI